MKIKYQLSIVFVLVILLTVIMVALVLSNHSLNSMKENAVANYSSFNRQIALNLNETIEAVDHYYNFLISNRLVFGSIRERSFGTDPDSYEPLIYLKDLLFSIITISNELHSAYFFTDSGNIISSLSNVIYPEYLSVENLRDKSILNTIYKDPATTLWITEDVGKSELIYYLRAIRDPSDGNILGVLCFAVKAQFIENNIEMLFNSSNQIYICNEDGRPFMSTLAEDKMDYEKISEIALKGEGFSEVDDKYFFCNQNTNSWFVISELGKKELYDIRETWLLTLLSSLIFMTAAVVLSLFITSRVTKDLTLLADSMDESNEGLLRKAEIHGSNTETRILARSYNRMISRINALTSNLRNEIEEKEKAEHEVESLVKFTNENPAPIVRLSPEHILNHANISANERIVDKLFIEKTPSALLNNELSDLDSLKEFDVSVENRSYKIRAISTSANEDIFLHFHDYTTEREYEYLQNLWDNMFENSVEGIIITDSEGLIEKVNGSFTKITGFSYDEVKGKSTNVLKSNRHDTEFYTKMWDSLLKTGKWSGEIWNRRKSGEAYPEWLGITSFTEAGSGRRMYFAVFHDISDKKQNEERLQWMISYDALTGLPLRALFLSKAKSEFKISARNSEYCAIMLMNIDGLKYINNNYGPHNGDAVLQEFSRRLKLSLREEDVVSRFGGDEFVILAPRLKDQGHIYSILKRLGAALDDPFEFDDGTVDLSVSLGIAFSPDDGKSVQDVITKASSALRRTKTNRRGSYSLFDSRLDDVVLANSEMELALRKAVNLGEFELFFQPKIDAVKNRIDGFEALLRWKKAQNEYIPPFKFIPVAEESGIIVDIGYLVIREACEFIMRMKEKGYSKIKVSINISARQLAEPDFIENLMKIIDANGIQPAELDLEVTESITASEVYNAIESLTELSDSGFTISIDDFGTGYSSLKYLLTLPFDTMKIDKSFIDQIGGKEGGTAVLDSMISLAHSLKKGVVAEGVEVEEQLEYLVQHKCNVIQGYLFSRPVPGDDAIALLDSGKYSI